MNGIRVLIEVNSLYTPSVRHAELVEKGRLCHFAGRDAAATFDTHPDRFLSLFAIIPYHMMLPFFFVDTGEMGSGKSRRDRMTKTSVLTTKTCILELLTPATDTTRTSTMKPCPQSLHVDQIRVLDLTLSSVIVVPAAWKRRLTNHDSFWTLLQLRHDQLIVRSEGSYRIRMHVCPKVCLPASAICVCCSRFMPILDSTSDPGENPRAALHSNTESEILSHHISV